MDITEAILARSDQLNAVDLVEPVIVTIVDVRKGNAEQPVHIITDTFGASRPFKPSKTVLRDLGKAWGRDTQPWIGRRIELYNEPTVKWAGKEIGGIRVSGLSNITEPIQTAHTISRGQYKQVTIRPIPSGTDPKALPAVLEDIRNASSVPTLRAAWDLAGKRGVQGHPDVVAATNKRKAELETPEGEK